MQYKIRMLVDQGDLTAGETYWAEEFPSNRNWMFAGLVRIPKSTVNRIFTYEEFRYRVPGLKNQIYLRETNVGYEVVAKGIEPCLLQRDTKKTLYFRQQNICVVLKLEGSKLSHVLMETTQETA